MAGAFIVPSIFFSQAAAAVIFSQTNRPPGQKDRMFSFSGNRWMGHDSGELFIFYAREGG